MKLQAYYSTADKCYYIQFDDGYIAKETVFLEVKERLQKILEKEIYRLTHSNKIKISITIQNN